MICQCRRCRFSIASCYTNDLATTFKPVSKFDFADDRDSFLPNCLYEVVFFGYSRALHDLGSIQNFFFRMSSIFKRNAMLFEVLSIIVFYRASIRNEHVISLPACKYRCANSTFTGSQYDKSFAHWYFQSFHGDGLKGVFLKHEFLLHKSFASKPMDSEWFFTY